jgi:hypothetical protein
MKNLTIYSDAGHAWLKVKKAELLVLGIADKITAYSYQYKEWAYLEEDCDLSRFAEAIGREKWQSIKDKIPIRSSEFSRIRHYSRYNPAPYREPKPGDYVDFVGNSKKYQIVDAKTCRDESGNVYRIPENRLTGNFFEGF